MYTIYRYANKAVPYKHVLLKRSYSDSPEDKKEPVVHDERLSNSLSRTRRLFEDYAFSNDFTHFCTFTFDRSNLDAYDYDMVTRKIRKFFNNYRQRVDAKFRYMIIPENHADGAWHFHGLFKNFVGLVEPETIPKRIDGVLTQVPNTRHYLDFPAYSSRFGFFNASKITSLEMYADKVGYCVSYIAKAFKDVSFKNRQLLLKSQGLEKPEKVFVSYGNLSLLHPDFENEFCCVAWRGEDETASKYRYWSYASSEDVDFIRLQNNQELSFYCDVPSNKQLTLFEANSIDFKATASK